MNAKHHLLPLAVLLLVAAAARAAAPATLTIHADQPGARISPLLYGIFFEEINRSGDGGLYAEMLQNRSFEDAKVPVGWIALPGEGRMELDHSKSLNDANVTSLRLEGHVRVANRGFKGAPYPVDQDPAVWMPAFEKGAAEMTGGVAVRQGKEYALSLYARGAGPLKVTIEKPDGTALAAQAVEGLGADWKKFEFTLSASATEPEGRLVVAAEGVGPAFIDMVSLMPKGELFRPDLFQLLADMKPAFVRFPGGCWVEGDYMRFAYRWKKTIGDVAARPGLWNRWGYYCNDGLGFHEYLLLCEKLGAEPLFVINCGMSHKEHVPMDKMGEFVQDALDAIEYCNGPADSKWGALRAKAGHPAPFNLKYMEIGNENGGDAYQERYPLFHDAIKKLHPAMHLILDYVPSKTRPSEIVDEHYYNSPEFFMRNAGRYDSYDRAAHKVYVGEYAVTKGCGRGNLAAAVGEAAFMTGMERNGDVVALSSYAPLFEHVGWKHWNPNAILFDASRSYGTPSWQVQTMFGRNRGDVVLPVQVTAPEVASTETRGGMVGVGTWRTQAEFKDVRVTQDGKTLWEGPKGWRLAGNSWKLEDGVLRQTGNEQDVRAYAGKKEWKDYTLTLKARKLGGSEGFLVIFGASNEKDKCWWNLGGWGNTGHAIESRGVDCPRVPGKIETGRWYDLKVELKGASIRCYLDGKLVHEVTGKSMPGLYAVASRTDATGEIILKTVNASDAPLAASIALSGAGKLAPQAVSWVLTSASPDDENSLDEPTKIAPKEEALSNVAPEFPHTFPAHSVTVMRLQGAK